MKKKTKFVITKDDSQLLYQLWRWKFLTTSVIHELVYKPRSLSACYQRLNHLERNNYIESFCSKDGKMWFYQLTDAGFRCLDLEDYNFNQNGFRSEHVNHDFWVNSFHICLARYFFDLKNAIFTEQELRRFEIESYPEWVPHTKRHRPDGWCIETTGNSNHSRLFGIEVELNRKPNETYADLGLFYSEAVNVDTVLWLVKTEVDAKFILHHLSRKTENALNIHSFITIDQFIKDQWQSPITLGKNIGLPIKSLFNKRPINELENYLEHLLFDLRKYPIKSIINSFKQSQTIKVSK